ncbi:zinc finger protein BrlA [Exophiala viscosa]|nr:zinc finger protein BrlA [Exophiala viscosa]
MNPAKMGSEYVATSMEMSPINDHMKIDEGPFQMLPHVDTTSKRESPLGFMADCPSLASSFFSSESSIAGSQGQRRSSLGSCSSSTSPGIFFTPPTRNETPITPIMADSGMMTYHKYMKPSPYLESCQNMFHFQEDDQYPQEYMWMSGAGSSPCLPYVSGVSDMMLAGPGQSLYDSAGQIISNVVSNPSLTKPMFDGPCTISRGHGADNDMLRWTVSHTAPPTETIEPSVAFQHMLPSSPCYKLEPSTPVKAHVPSSAILSSSPLSMVSPSIVPSQHDIDICAYSDVEQALRFCETKKRRTRHDRLERRDYERRRPLGVSKSRSKSTTSKSGMHCDPIIGQNQYACGYPGCEKKFKRQEHKKRHEKSVHEKHDHPMYKCWVPECNTLFSRSDNLKSHIRNTHSKKPGVRGNRYVATLDKSSEYYDPDWVGELDKNGFPIL